MAVTNKCNITKLAIDRYNEVIWGAIPNPVTSNSILENYLIYLSCETVDYEPCLDKDDCTNDSFILTCAISITEIISVIDETVGNKITFTAIYINDNTTDPDKNIFEWEYDTSVFTLAGELGKSSLELTIKPGKSLTDIVVPITVTLTDENKCVESKTCFYVRGTMDCTAGYVPCSNPSNLRLKNKVTSCSAPSNLSLTKKL